MIKEFKIYDLVHINNVLPEMMSHFTCDEDAIITEYVYAAYEENDDWKHS